MRKIIFIFLLCLLTVQYTQTCNAEVIDWDRLVLAVIQVESSGNPDAVGTSGEIGLMQISPIVLKEWDIEKSSFANSCAAYPPCKYCKKPKIDLYNPKDNKRVGTWYLKRLCNHYGCKTIEQILAGYNAGPSRKNNPPKSTKRYIKKVMEVYNGNTRRR